MGANIKSLCVKSSKFTSIIEEFTSNTFIMVVFSDPSVQQGAVAFNITCARKYFEKGRSEGKTESENLKCFN